MQRAILWLSAIVILTVSIPVLAQQDPRRARRRAPPAPDKHMPVRQPQLVQGFTPEAGPAGIVVTITGQNFDETTRVRFNGRELPVVGRSTVDLRVRIPQGSVSDRFVVAKAGFSDVTSDRLFNVVRPPSITSFSPTRGAAGTTVRILGAHFLPGDEVVLGAQEVPVLSTHPTHLSVRIPERVTSGRFGIRRNRRAIVAWSVASFDVIGLPPVIAAFSPDRGGRGTVVRIQGQNFEPSDVVELSGLRLAVSSRDASHLDVVIGHQGSGRFVVSGREGRRAESPSAFTVLRPLWVKRFSPGFGPPRTRITVEGAGFVAGDVPLVGSAMLTVLSLADETIVAELPAGVASGPVGVQRGAQRVYARGTFAVIHPPVITGITPSAGPPGVKVTIQGRNFIHDAAVLLAGQRLPLQRRGDTELGVVIPPGVRSGQLVVVTRAGSAQSPITFMVTPYAEITSFFPLHGLPGARVSIRGAHFHPGMRALLGETPLREIQRTETLLVVEIPSGAASNRIALETQGRRVMSPMVFTVDQPRPEVEFSFSPAAGVRGSEVTLTVTPPRAGVVVLFDGRLLPKKVLQGGRVLVVTIPSDARTGYFELELNGQRYRAPQPFRVR